MADLRRFFLFYHRCAAGVYRLLHRYLQKPQGYFDEKWDYHQKYSVYGGVGEMALLHLWVHTLPEGDYLNLLRDDENHCVFDNSVGESTGFTPISMSSSSG